MYCFFFVVYLFVFCKHKTAYEMRISDWSSDVCSSDLVEVSLHTMSREEQVKARVERRIDVGFNRFFSDYSGLFWQTIASQRMLAAIPSENRLASKSSISLSDLNQQPLILYPPIERAGGFSNYLLRMLHQRGVSALIVQNVEDVITALSLVSSGLGIALGVNSVRNLRRSEEHTSELQ